MQRDMIDETESPAKISPRTWSDEEGDLETERGPSENVIGIRRDGSSESPGEAPLYTVNFVVVMACQCLFTLANALLTHYSRWIEFLGGTVEQVGYIMGLGAVASLMLRPWIGQWIDRWGARTIWAVGYITFGAGAALNLTLDGLGLMIYMLRAINVFGAAMVFASGLTYVTQRTPSHRRTEAIGILGAGGFVGIIVGPFLGDLLLGTDARSRGQFELLFLLATFCVAVPLIATFWLDDATTRAANRLTLGDFVRTCGKYWPGSILGVCIGFGVCMTVPFVFLASYVDASSLHIPRVSVVGIFYVAYAGWGLFVRIASRRLPDRIGRRRILLLGALFMSVGMSAFHFVSEQHPWMILVPALLCGTGHSLMFHTMTSLALDSFPSSVCGAGSTLSLMMVDVGVVGGAPILGELASRYGYGAIFWSAAFCCGLSSVIYATLHRSSQLRTLD